MARHRFKVGQKVAFKADVQSHHDGTLFKKGDVVTIAELYTSPNILERLTPGYKLTEGHCGRFEAWAEEWFEAVVEAKYPSAVSEVLTKFAPVEERSDVPVKVTEPELEPA